MKGFALIIFVALLISIHGAINKNGRGTKKYLPRSNKESIVTSTKSPIIKSNKEFNVIVPKTPRKSNAVVNNQNEKILLNNLEMNSDGSYHYQYETSNGIAVEEKGIGGKSVQGSSSYISPDGKEIRMTYTADETGFHPVGDHIPKMPGYILRSLEYIRTHPYRSKVLDKTNVDDSINLIQEISRVIAPPTERPLALKATNTKRQYNSINNGKIVTKGQKKRF